jgi:GPH family glycoside/pentoside/hexuronide:cation symporter
MQATGRLTGSVRFGYSLGSLTNGAFGTVPGLLLLPYLTDSLGVRAGLAGALVLLPKAWDVILNPISGRISDRTVTRIGARRPYLLFAGIAAGILFAGIFAGPFGTSTAAPVWTVALFMLCATAYAFYQVPYNAMPAELTDDYAERTRVMTWRIAVLAIAILICGAVAPAIAKGSSDSIVGHRYMGIFVGVIMIVGALAAFVGTRRAPVSAVTESAPSFRAQITVARRNTA